MECQCDELRDKIRNMVITFRNDSNDAIAEIDHLTTQLDTKNNSLLELNLQVDTITAQLTEANQKKETSATNARYYAEKCCQLETQLADANNRIEGDKTVIRLMVEERDELKRQLSRYQGAVEILFKVTGIISNETLYFLPEVIVPVDWKGKNVRVLVIPEDHIVDANKTMKEVE